MSTAEDMEAGRKQSEYWANPGASRPQPKPDPTGKGSGVAARKNDNVIPFGPTGNTGGQRGGGGGTGPMGNTGPSGNTGPMGNEPRPNAGQVKQSGTSPAMDFLDDFFGNDKRHLVAIKKIEGKDSYIKAHHFDAVDRAGQQKFITDHGNAGFDIYFSPNPI